MTTVVATIDQAADAADRLAAVADTARRGLRIADRQGFEVPEGVYLGVTFGPVDVRVVP